MTARMNKQMQFSFHDKGNFKSSVLICFRENSFLGPKNFLLPYMALILCFIPKSQYDTPSGFHPSTVKCHTKRQFCPSPSSSSPSSLLPLLARRPDHLRRGPCRPASRCHYSRAVTSTGRTAAARAVASPARAATQAITFPACAASSALPTSRLSTPPRLHRRRLVT